jgi:thioredoxin reductase (NADPH)
MATNIPGLYAAGDVRVNYRRQISTAVGDGAPAAVSAEKYLEDQH